MLGAVGDGAGGESGETDVTNMIASWQPNLFLYLGDVYEKGSPTEFLNSYGPSGGAFFGQFDPITDPTVGNHEYTAGQAPGYFAYWHTPPNWYSLNTHGWHVVSLNSNLDGRTTSAQYKWLSNDLQQNTQACTLVYFHHPLFNIGPEPVPTRFTAIWPLLAQHGVDLVLNGHDHDYQRWVPMNGSGTPSPSGPTEIVVGTGGHSLQSFVSSDPRVAYSLSGSFGAMQLDLNPGGASYQYMTTGGGTVDSGTIACNPNGTDTTPPSTPTSLNATTVAQTSISPGLVNLTWSASTDNVAVASYKIYRDETLVGTVGPQTSFSDNTVTPDTTYSYTAAGGRLEGQPVGRLHRPAGDDAAGGSDLQRRLRDRPLELGKLRPYSRIHRCVGRHICGRVDRRWHQHRLRVGDASLRAGRTSSTRSISSSSARARTPYSCNGSARPVQPRAGPARRRSSGCT